MEFCFPAHFVERQVTFYFILKRFPRIHCNSRDSRYVERWRVTFLKPIPKGGPAEFSALEPSWIFNEQIIRVVAKEPHSVGCRFLSRGIICREDEESRAHV